jgi:hypothetical protein
VVDSLSLAVVNLVAFVAVVEYNSGIPGAVGLEHGDVELLWRDATADGLLEVVERARC